MQTNIYKFFRISFLKNNKRYKITPINETMQLLNEKILIQKPDEINDAFEIYYPSVKINDIPVPFPKLELNKEMFFTVEFEKHHPGETFDVLTIRSNNSVNSIPVNVRRKLTTFVYDNIPAVNEFVTFQIKTLSEKLIHEQVLKVLADDTNRKAFCSFDFSNYPFEVYTAELVEQPGAISAFVVDKSGELTGKSALLRIQYDEQTLRYSTDDILTDNKITKNIFTEYSFSI